VSLKIGALAVLKLHELQATFRRAILEGDNRAIALIAAEIESGDLSASERVAVYRNNIFAALSDSLRETFPVVCRLVDERFFSYATHEFIRAHPPTVPALAEYGGAFPDFLAKFPPCRDLAYLPDIAHLEWLMNIVAVAPDESPLRADALAAVGPDQAAGLGFRMQPTYRYLASPWPIDRIWRANQKDATEETIDLGTEGARLEVSRRDETVVFRAMGEAEFAFRKALSDGLPLGEAIERALATDDDFPARDALMAIFREGAVAGLTHSPVCMEQP
jgi:hypothetical protein